MTTHRSQLPGWALGAALVAAAAPVTPTHAQDAVRVGILTCEAVEGTRLNLLVRSTVDVKCTFEHDGKKESYRGETGIEFGLDLSFRKNEQFAFTVLATTEGDFSSDALAGKYVGVSASATAGVGLGAATLVGGSNKTLGLQPLALSSNQGFGLAGGIGFLYIEPDK